ncbi:hypothetical protein Baya_8367 [Bagarius yarrelli]|uniref:Uncharacterized protein n=1 Tax=Bagarius yarrelli TaxID=175774 RepID=A0A556U4T1_BAGYA|nr:hypothetical protein Baya_8367 [Bagarius yarrelli]
MNSAEAADEAPNDSDTDAFFKPAYGDDGESNPICLTTGWILASEAGRIPLLFALNHRFGKLAAN